MTDVVIIPHQWTLTAATDLAGDGLGIMDSHVVVIAVCTRCGLIRQNFTPSFIDLTGECSG